MHFSGRAITLFVVLTTSLAAAAQQPSQGGSPSPSDRAMMEGMDKMNRSMAGAAMTGDSDRDFVAMMIPHHAGAIDMAQAELQYGSDPALRRLAMDIIAAQKQEIATMMQWQASHAPHP